MHSTQKKNSTGKVRQRIRRNRIIYVIRIKDELCKIGITGNLKNRLKWYKNEFNQDPVIIKTLSLPYRCARCFEFGIAWQAEYFHKSSLDDVLTALNSAYNLTQEKKCGKESMSHLGISAWDFYDKCGIMFCNHLNQEPASAYRKKVVK